VSISKRQTFKSQLRVVYIFVTANNIREGKTGYAIGMSVECIWNLCEVMIGYLKK
jgi:hypothetical protein